MKFMRAQNNTVFNVAHVVEAGPANVIYRTPGKGTGGWGQYLMVALSNGHYAVPVDNDGEVLPSSDLPTFLKLIGVTNV